MNESLHWFLTGQIGFVPAKPLTGFDAMSTRVSLMGKVRKSHAVFSFINKYLNIAVKIRTRMSVKMGKSFFQTCF